ncbi:BrnT family toxin [Thalassomonas viridans]|uniref:BrnT family toxin n=1 Tax=Thalassomonas viridans TaxID=137584 RepID=A0AAE9Z7J1_9GAMM|nr:BrnT family toxin [Thalassomonas viridans]
MSFCNFEWDRNKAESNIKEHGVTFEEAKSVFFDEFGRLIPDPDSSIGEEWFILLGQSSEIKTLVVCHCYKAEDGRIRSISARKATTHERKQYERFRYARTI